MGGSFMKWFPVIPVSWYLNLCKWILPQLSLESTTASASTLIAASLETLKQRVKISYAWTL